MFKEILLLALIGAVLVQAKPAQTGFPEPPVNKPTDKGVTIALPEFEKDDPAIDEAPENAPVWYSDESEETEASTKVVVGSKIGGGADEEDTTVTESPGSENSDKKSEEKPEVTTSSKPEESSDTVQASPEPAVNPESEETPEKVDEKPATTAVPETKVDDVKNNADESKPVVADADKKDDKKPEEDPKEPAEPAKPTEGSDDFSILYDTPAATTTTPKPPPTTTRPVTSAKPAETTPEYISENTEDLPDEESSAATQKPTTKPTRPTRKPGPLKGIFNILNGAIHEVVDENTKNFHKGVESVMEIGQSILHATKQVVDAKMNAIMSGPRIGFKVFQNMEKKD